MNALAKRVVGGLRGLSLRARLYAIFLAVLGLALVVGTVSLVSDYQMLAALESYLNTDQRIAGLSTNSAQAMLKARRYEKDFLLKVGEYGFREAKSRYATLLKSELERVGDNMAMIRSLRDEPDLVRETREIEAALGRYETGFLRVVEYCGALERRNGGIVARFTATADELESMVRVLGRPRLENAVLRMRRDEKNDAVRGLEKYVVALGEAVRRFQADVRAAALPRAAQEKLARLADEYLALSRQYVAVEKRIDAETDAYLDAVRVIEPRLDRLYATTTENAAATLERVRGLARATLWTAIGASLGAIMLGLAFASIVSRNIGRSVDAFMDAVERIGRGDFDIQVSEHEGREFKVLTAMADALQQAHGEVQARLAELAAANHALHERNQALADAQHQLLHAEKMASIGQLAAGVAHEINNPIGFVRSNLSMLGDYLDQLLALVAAYEAVDSALPESARTAIDRARAEAEIDFLRGDAAQLVRESKEGIDRVIRIVRDLREFSRVGEKDQWQLADLHRGLDSTLNLIGAELERKAKLVREYDRLPEIECLPSQLNQVFLNLLQNAAEAIDEIDASDASDTSDDRGTITVRTGVAGDEVWVEIADTGHGIPEAELARIFDPFFTTRPVGQGTGLGLSLSYGIVRAHHGRIEVDSTVGQGSRFRVWLPVRRPRPEAVAA